MSNFLPAHKKTGGHEGGYSNHPNDKGKETIFGISRVYWPDWVGWFLVDAIKRKVGGVSTKEERRDVTRLLKDNNDFMGHVYDFYEENFFNKYKLNLFTSQAIAEVVYDVIVNGGKPFLWLQQLLNVQNRQGRDWEDIIEDGKFGNNSMRVLNVACALPKKYDFTSEFILLDKLLSYRDDYFKDITMNNEKNEDFYNGWSIRTINQRISYYKDFGVM